MKLNVDFKELTSAFKVDFEENNAAFDFKLDQITAATAERLKHAGALAVVSQSEALKGELSGEVVAASDISPVEHNVGVKVSGVADLTAVKVKRQGKNLCELGTKSFTREGYYALERPLKAGVTYTFSAYVESTDTDSEFSSVRFYDSSGTYISGHWIERKNAAYKVDFTPSRDVKNIYLYASTASDVSVGDTATFANILIALKGNDTEYEPFIEPLTYPVNADGTVEGVTSLFPNMTLLTNTSGAVITADYIKDIDKAFAAQTLALAMTGGE